MRAAAIYDLDGTLLLGRSAEQIFLRYLVGRRQVGLRSFWGWMRGLCSGALFSRENKGYLAGMDRARVLAMARYCFKTRLVPRISAAAVAAIERHKAQGRIAGILSGSPDFMVELFREHLDLDFACGTRLELDGPRFTGRILGTHPYAKGKVPALEQLLQAYAIDPTCSYGYANDFKDRFFLEVLAHPVAVNPDPRLQCYARSRNWPIWINRHGML